jgi:glycine cleavage system H protein
MALIRGCVFPDALFYDVPRHVWYREEAPDRVVLGLTAVAVALAGEILAFTPKRVGREVEPGRSCATIESGKWVGPVRAACAGTITAINEALMDEPRLANRDPYGEGWMLAFAPADWPAARASLVTGDAMAAAYERQMEEEGFAGCGDEP